MTNSNASSTKFLIRVGYNIQMFWIGTLTTFTEPNYYKQSLLPLNDTTTNNRKHNLISKS